MLPEVSPSAALPFWGLGALLLASLSRLETRRRWLQIGFHTLYGLAMLLCPRLLHGSSFIGNLDAAHIFLLRFEGPLHLGFAFFLYRIHEEPLRCDPIVPFAKALVAFFSLFTQLFIAYYVTESKKKGLKPSSQYFYCAPVLAALWTLVEAVRVYRHERTSATEVNVLCQRTQRCIEGLPPNVDNFFLLDAGMAFLYTFLNYAYPSQILKLVFKREFAPDTIHNLFCRQFGIWALFVGIVSIAAPNFTVHHQKAYVTSRVMTQGLFFVLNVYGHWGAETIYSHNHISPFMISGFYITFLLSIYYKLKRTVESETSNEVVEENDVPTEDEEETEKPKSQ
ncbi:hypothetical protein QR680_017125 [Steinernema hermaphroditum]|uniref:Uncharacterized protein n=1 Tax=Steinernema hermaphroditum TaxID=289476 RepID=A0AA39HDE2_9BILA|nr:hypothetical protein QR680_017125 [Steinernema hermaphroditum]